MIRVLFVCLGNICRSPMAEAVFAHKVRAAGLEDKIEVDSAATGHWNLGNAPHRGTRAVLEREGIDYTHVARLITPRDLEAFDYILTMDDQNLADVQAMGPARAIIRPFLEYAPDCGETEVPDPYYTGGFEGVYDLIEAAAEGLLQAIRQEHRL